MALRKTMALSAVAAGIVLSMAGAHAASLLSASEPATMKASELAAKEKSLTNFPLMNAVKSSIATLSNSEVELIAPGGHRQPGKRKTRRKYSDRSRLGLFVPDARAGVHLFQLPESDR